MWTSEEHMRTVGLPRILMYMRPEAHSMELHIDLGM